MPLRAATAWMSSTRTAQPHERSTGQHLEQDVPERVRRGLLGVVDRHQLEIAVAERDDPVVRALADMVAAGQHLEAELGLDPLLARSRSLVP